MRKTNLFVPNGTKVFEEKSRFGRFLMACLGLFNLSGGIFATATEAPVLGVICVAIGVVVLMDASKTHRRLRR